MGVVKYHPEEGIWVVTPILELSGISSLDCLLLGSYQVSRGTNAGTKGLSHGLRCETSPRPIGNAQDLVSSLRTALLSISLFPPPYRFATSKSLLRKTWV